MEKALIFHEIDRAKRP